MLDACLFNSDIRASTVAHTMPVAQVIFRDKLRLPYDNLPDGIRGMVPAQNDNTTELLLANNSGIRVGVSLRSGTLQYLHVSEYGKICAKFPEKAREVRFGALNTFDKNQIVFVESTRGRPGRAFLRAVPERALEAMSATSSRRWISSFISRPGTRMRPTHLPPDRWTYRRPISIISQSSSGSASS
jgi:hypothetical protein